MSSILYYTNSPYGRSPIDGGNNNDKQVEKKLSEDIKQSIVVDSAKPGVKPEKW